MVRTFDKNLLSQFPSKREIALATIAKEKAGRIHIFQQHYDVSDIHAKVQKDVRDLIEQDM